MDKMEKVSTCDGDVEEESGCQGAGVTYEEAAEDKKRIIELCQKVSSLDADDFNEFLILLQQNENPIVREMCIFIERKRGT